MKSLRALLVCLCIGGIFSCNKEPIGSYDGKPLAPYKFVGRVTDCKTGEPVEGIKVQITTHGGTGWLTAYNEDAGRDVTDPYGYYEITPVLYDDAEYYRFEFQSEYYSGGEQVYVGDISQPTGTNEVNGTALALTYLKVIFFNTRPVDSNDVFSLGGYTKSTCQAGGAYHKVAESREMTYGSPYGGYKGRMQNEFAVFRVTGNDTNTVQYFTYKGGVKSATTEVDLFCPPRDTTYLHIDY